MVWIGVLRVLFNEAASWGLVRRLFLKLDTNVLVLLLSCALGPPIPLSFLVSASLRCPDTRLVYRRPVFIASLSSTTVFSCANIIAKWFSIDQLAY